MTVIKQLTEEEKQIYALIDAAKNKEGLITEYRESDGYIFCKLDGITYELCFGCNPAPDHPCAERAIRASRFVTRLMDKIRKDYSCYFVQSDVNFYPHESALREKLNSGRTFAKIPAICTPKPEDAYGTNCFVSSYELEVEIVATVGETYQRMVDFLTVKLDENGAVYTHSQRISAKELTKPIADEEKKDAEKRADDIMKLVLDGQLPGKSKNENIRKDNIRRMLEALTNSNNSRFSRFINDVSKQEGVNVGQISIKPCALLIDAIDDKKYVYRASCLEGTGDLSVIWRSSLGKFEENTPLYLQITKAKEFAGFTNVKNEYPISNFDSLVLAHRATKQGNDTKIAPDEWTLDESYDKLIRNCAVPVEIKGKTKYFFKKYAEKVDGEWRLKLECEKCALTDESHYKGNLSSEYYLKNGEIQFGRIYTAGAQSFSCETCRKTIYYRGSEHLNYRSLHRLLDGNHYCDLCGDTVRNGNLKYQKTENVHSGNKIGTVYARINENGFLPVENGGNVFVCANCGKPILYDSRIENNRCDICSNRICSNCANNSAGTPTRKKVLNTGTYACNRCASIPTIKTAFSNEAMRLFTVEDENGQEQMVLDNAESPELIFHCVECGKPRYYENNARTKHKKCSSCSRIICSCCSDKCTEDDTYLALTYCRDCDAKRNEKYENEKKIAEDIFQKVTNQEIKVFHAEKNANLELKNHVTDHINRYLPYFSMADRKLVRSSIRKNRIDEAIKVECLSVSVLEKTVNYKYKLSVRGGKAYLFYRVNNNLTYGGLSQ